MKKTLILICAAALALVGCQKQLAPEQVSEPASSTAIEAYALPSASTKAVYEENAGGALAGKWEVDDVIFGLNGSTPFEFKVTAVDAEGKATLVQTTEVAFAAGDVLQAAFCPGKTAADLSGGSFALDLSEQAADVVPVLLLSKATVAEGPSVSFAFTNATSVVALKAPVFPAAISEGKAIKNVTLSGHEIVSSGVVSVVGGEFVFTPDAPCNFIKKNVSLAAVDVDGTSYKIDEPVYIVIPSAGKISKISALDNKNGFFTYDLSASPVGTAAPEASKYYTLSGKTFTKVDLPVNSTIEAGGVAWAKCNMGASSPTSQGDIYRWADSGLIYTSKGSTAASIVYDESHAAVGFAQVVGECYYNGSSDYLTCYDKYNAIDGKTVLEPVDDIVQLTYPGTDWRMPTNEDVIALAAKPAEYDSEGHWVKFRNNVGDENVLVLTKDNFGGTGKLTKTQSGRYWTSSVMDKTTGTPDKKYSHAKYFVVATTSFGYDDNGSTNKSNTRNFGYSVRPVKTVE